MKKTQITFVCDNCSKEKILEEGSTYPYDKGWVYIYQLEYKKSTCIEDAIKDKHFCKAKCMLEFIGKLWK